MKRQFFSRDISLWLPAQIFDVIGIVDFQNEIWTDHRVATETGLRL